MKKLIWIWKRFWGKQYRIVYTDKLKENEILVFNHTFYIGGIDNENKR